MHEQSYCKVWTKRNENFWSYRLHKLGTPKVLRTDGRKDWRIEPITRPAFPNNLGTPLNRYFGKQWSPKWNIA